MVAYSFNKIFAAQVADLTKRQTVRPHRKRHARTREPVQLYTAMRTKYCRKLVEPDPVCVRVDEIRIVLEEIDLFGRPSGRIDAIEINGRELNVPEIEMFAIRDGFDPSRILAPPRSGHVYRDGITARLLMGMFWHGWRGPGAWQGVIVYWAPRDIAVCA